MLKTLLACVTGALWSIPPSAAAAEVTGHALELHAEGVQVYTCRHAAGADTWTLRGPEAVLRDAAGHVVVHHFAGPTWRALDGSVITGTVVTASTAPAPNAVAWLIVRTTSSGGPGVLAHIAYVTRTETSGGTAPTTACGADVRVPYRALYTFFGP